MPYGLSTCYEAGWEPAVSSYSLFAGSTRPPRAYHHAFPTSYEFTCEQDPDAGKKCETAQDCADGVIAAPDNPQAVQCVNGKCLCAVADPPDPSKDFCAVGGVCMKKECATGAQELKDKLDEMQTKIAKLKELNGDDPEADEDALASSPLGKKKQKELQSVEQDMASRLSAAPTFEQLENMLENKAEDLAETATTGLEFQPSLRSMLREMGPVRLEAAVQDVSRGSQAILQANNRLQPGSIAMMTTSDVKLLDGVDDAISKALRPLVSLRKVLKSIRGNSALLMGHPGDWAMSQDEEPQDDSGRSGTVPSDETPAKPPHSDDVEAALAKKLEPQPNGVEAATGTVTDQVPPPSEDDREAPPPPNPPEEQTPPAAQASMETQAWVALLQQVAALSSASQPARVPSLHISRSKTNRCSRRSRIDAGNFL